MFPTFEWEDLVDLFGLFTFFWIIIALELDKFHGELKIKICSSTPRIAADNSQ